MLEKFIVKRLLSYNNIVRLMSKNIDLNTLTYRNQSILLLCIKHDMEREVGLLIKNGINLDMQYEKGKTVLHFAIEWGKYDIAEMLIKNGANVNIGDSQSKTPLYYATMVDNQKIVNLLVKKGASVDKQDMFNETPLYVAIINKKNRVLDCLIKNSKKLKDIITIIGMTPLHLAVKVKNEKAVEELISQPIDVDMLDEEGQTAMLYAVKKGYTRIAKMLINKGANVNQIELDGGASLIDWACFRGYVDMVNLLLDNNSLITKNVKDWAFYRGEDEIIRKIRAAHCFNDEKNEKNINKEVDKLLRRGKTIADVKKYAVDNNKINMLKELLKIENDKNINKSAKSSDKNLIFTAAKNNNERMTNILMYNLAKDSVNALNCLLNSKSMDYYLNKEHKSDTRENIRNEKIDIENKCILNCIMQSKKANLAKTLTK